MTKLSFLSELILYGIFFFLTAQSVIGPEKLLYWVSLLTHTDNFQSGDLQDVTPHL